MPAADVLALPFAAVLLAGGKSRRMGRDKALLPLPDGSLLWQRQLGVLRALGPSELFISGPARPGFPGDITLLSDEHPDLGPLEGIATALGAMKAPLLVVLAIDLPAMTADFLQSLLGSSRAGSGMVPEQWQPTGFYEPLAAVYPRDCLPIARACLERHELAMQGFIRAAAAYLRTHLVTSEEQGLFTNWNEPAAT